MGVIAPIDGNIISLPNQSFEDGNHDFTGNGSVTSLTISGAVGGVDGSNALLMTCSGGAAPEMSLPLIPVVPNTTYIYAFFIYAPVTGRAWSAFVENYNYQAGVETIIGTRTTSATATNNATWGSNFTLLGFTTAATATHVKLGASTATTPAASELHYFDRFNCTLANGDLRWGFDVLDWLVDRGAGVW
jgi:hypothetical protein